MKKKPVKQEDKSMDLWDKFKNAEGEDLSKALNDYMKSTRKKYQGD